MVQLYKRKDGEILVNTATANNQSGGNIALLPGGGFVVVWSDGSMTGADTSSFAVRGQRFDANGNPVGGEFLVNSTVAGNQSGPTVATLSSGRFVVTWSDASATGGDTSGIAVRGQIFEADGTPVGAEFLINTATANNQSVPAIAELSGGGFVVTWLDNSGVGGDTSGTAVKAQIFDAAGAPVGGEFLANTTTVGSQGGSGLHVIGLAGGGFAMAYSTTTAIGGEARATVWVQRFDAAGAKVGDETIVNGETLGNINSVNITALNAGFIVTWAQQIDPIPRRPRHLQRQGANVRRRRRQARRRNAGQHHPDRHPEQRRCRPAARRRLPDHLARPRRGHDRHQHLRPVLRR